MYDALLLALPATALMSGRLPLPGSHGRALRALLLFLIASPSFNYFATYQMLDRLRLTPIGRLAVLEASGAALLLVFFILVWLAATGDARESA